MSSSLDRNAARWRNNIRIYPFQYHFCTGFADLGEIPTPEFGVHFG
jgi:hypothetical protein